MARFTTRLMLCGVAAMASCSDPALERQIEDTAKELETYEGLVRSKGLLRVHKGRVDLEEKLLSIQDLASRRDAHVRALVELQRRLPPAIGVTSLEMFHQDRPVRIQGQAASDEAVAQLVRELDGSRAFEDIELQPPQANGRVPAGTVEFSLAFQVQWRRLGEWDAPLEAAVPGTLAAGPTAAEPQPAAASAGETPPAAAPSGETSPVAAPSGEPLAAATPRQRPDVRRPANDVDALLQQHRGPNSLAGELRSIRDRSGQRLSRKSALRLELEALRSQLAAAHAALEAVPQDELDAVAAEIDERLRQSDELLPQEPHAEQAVQIVRSLLEQSGLETLDLQPTAKATKIALHSVHPVSCEVKGSLEELVRFCLSLARQRRILGVAWVSAQRTQAGEPDFTIRFQIHAYRFLPRL